MTPQEKFEQIRSDPMADPENNAVWLQWYLDQLQAELREKREKLRRLKLKVDKLWGEI